MLIILRTVITALLLIVVSLLLPDLRLGGRYFILLEATAIALLAQLLRHFLQEKLPCRERNILTGLSVVIILFLTKTIIPGVNLTILGILFLYLGFVLLETVLPNQVTSKIWRNE